MKMACLTLVLLLGLAGRGAAFPGDMAVYFGSFDPIHEGHLAVVRGALPDLGTGSVLVVPEPDERGNAHHASLADRLALVRAVGYRYAEVSAPDKELSEVLLSKDRDWRPRILAKLYDRLRPGAVLQEIVGMDVFNDLLRRDMIPRPVEPRMIVVVDRPGFPLDLDLLKRRHVAPGKILFLHPEVRDVNSRELRRDIARGLDVFGKVPVVVRKLIEALELYRDGQ